ncbi:MAG: cation:proton antiporter [Pseudomonadales bacterium]
MTSDTGDELLLIALGAVLVLGPATKHLCHRLRVPVAVGYILLGLILGSVVDIAAGASTERFEHAFSVLAQLGVVALLFRVGLTSHTSALLAKLPDASVIWIGNVLGTFVVGYLVSRYALGWTLETSLVVGTAFSATSIAISLSVWDELGLAGSDTGVMLLDVAELDDLSAALILAVLLGSLPTLLNGEDGFWQLAGTASAAVLFKLVLFVTGCYLFAHFLEARFTAFNRRMSDTPASLTISILGAGLAIAAVADALGFSVAIGALFAGLAFSRDPEAVRNTGSFTYFYEFLTPFFFIHVGMQTDVGALIQAADVGLVLFLAAALSKFAFTLMPALLSMSPQDAARLGVSMIPRAEIALVVIYECLAIDERIVPPEVFAGMILVVLATSVFAPVALRRLLVSAR